MSFKHLTVEEFCRVLAGQDPTPGGGSAAALTGALSAALCAMVARLTVGRKKYETSRPEMEKVLDQADALASELLNLVDEDAAAYNQVLAALKLPRASEEQKTARAEAVQAATQAAALAPGQTLKTLSRLPDLIRSAMEKGNENCLTDAAVAAQLLLAAAKGAALNVRVNVSSIEDQDFTARVLAESESLLAGISRSVEALESLVKTRLG
ncbi:MAG: cyclodeaminase/cyclohydrolase family protein [Thermodesulfobacteriota bacterium]